MPSPLYDSPRVLAAIVTHDRLSLLEECITHVRAQTRASDILVVDNGSTDATDAWLADQRDIAYIRQRNVGGAGGFHTALKAGYALGYDLVWCMDDDTVPERSCLQRLVQSFVRCREEDDRPVGWVCSTVNWVDGSPAVMNRAVVKPSDAPDSADDRPGIPSQSCSFVSVCVSRDAIGAVGLPLREMFVWLDDSEYTTRIVKAGFRGILAPGSVAIHRTPANVGAGAVEIDQTTRWKYRFRFRNTATLMRTRSRGSLTGFLYEFTQAVWRTTLALIERRKKRWLPYAWYWLFVGLFFRPRIEPADRSWDYLLADLL